MVYMCAGKSPLRTFCAVFRARLAPLANAPGSALGSRRRGPRAASSRCAAEEPTMDAIYIGLTVLLLGLTFGLVQLCERV